MANPNTHQIIQLTDFHLGSRSNPLYRGINSAESLKQILDQLKTQQPQPDRYLLTGDLAEEPSPETYERVALAFKEYAAPIHFVPGNHDIPDLMRTHLKAAGFHDDPVITWDNWRILLLNSSQPESSKGKLGSRACQWLSETLEALRDYWIVIALHHHPIPSGSTWMDTMMIEDRETFLETIQTHGKVKGVIFGHVHQEIDQMWNNIRFLGSPSTCAQFAPGSKTFATENGRPGYRSIELDRNGQLTTRVVRLGENV